MCRPTFGENGEPSPLRLASGLRLSRERFRSDIPALKGARMQMPWVKERPGCPRPEGPACSSAKIHLWLPFRGFDCWVVRFPRALPWAGPFGPFRPIARAHSVSPDGSLLNTSDRQRSIGNYDPSLIGSGPVSRQQVQSPHSGENRIHKHENSEVSWHCKGAAKGLATTRGVFVTSLLILLACRPFVADEKTREFCKVCHTETVQDFLAHPHSDKGLDCDSCHGESVKHRSSQGHTEPDRIASPHEVPALCGGCHPGKGGTKILEQYSSSKHGTLVLSKARVRAPHCGNCHGVHSVRAPLGIEAQCKRCHTQLPASCAGSPTSAKTRVACVNCHSAHLFAAKR